jgi:hypothetical protein
MQKSKTLFLSEDLALRIFMSSMIKEFTNIIIIYRFNRGLCMSLNVIFQDYINLNPNKKPRIWK